MLNEGEKAPLFCLPNDKSEKICLDQFKDKWVVIYFYPRDNTPGCTTEACDFSANITDFVDIDAVVIGISPDSPERHAKFIAKHDLKHILLSDEDHKVLELYDTWRKKLMYGKELFGVIRSTYLINPQGVIAKVWPKVKVKGHVIEVREVLKSLK
ncbi:MAG: peroxiredoxin [Candidatus Heimdallarchaeota archaeon]|nr:peroxiredoxin [Candidatus Heimdallarchaeota archaeon]MCK4612321.1 peroxiredoxin [Candidatus Heimdallarchaeota archaeon]